MGITHTFNVEYYTFVYAVMTKDIELRLKVVIRQKSGEPKKFFSCFKMIHTKFEPNSTQKNTPIAGFSRNEC